MIRAHSGFLFLCLVTLVLLALPYYGPPLVAAWCNFHSAGAC